MTPEKRALLVLLAVQLANCGDDDPPPPPKLMAGGHCETASQCETGFCVPVADSSPSARVPGICCAIPCAEGTQCDSSGGFCVECFGPDCVKEAESLGVRGLPLGTECQWNVECRDGSCRSDVEGHSRCCEQGCSGDTVCLADGQCGCRDGNPSRGPCEGGAASDQVEGNPGPSDVVQMTSGLSAGSGPMTCGNARVDPGEECDGDLACTTECHAIVCGNARVDPGEECEPPGVGDCSEQCLIYACGNRRLDPGEECDPAVEGLCGSDCLLAECGNGRTDPGEECDPPGTPTCDSSCLIIACGNGRLDGDEGCDPPGTGSCSDSCHPEGCGDSVVNGEEECDPPFPGQCDGRCLLVSCGNGRIESGEECDTPGQGGCSLDCSSQLCGDGRVDAGEQCDPPNRQTCSKACLTVECGDGRLDEGEQCDPGVDSSSCSGLCTTFSATGTYLYTFDTDPQGWSLNLSSPETLLQSSSLVWSAEQGAPTPGGLVLTVPFTQGGQKIELNAMRASGLDLTGATLRAQVRLLSGLAQASAPGAIKLFAKSGESYDYASGAWTELNLEQGFTSVVFDADTPTLKPGNFLARDVREIGFEVATFSGSQQVTTAVLVLDSVELGE